jgi:uncharacterized HAD superfamily protein
VYILVDIDHTMANSFWRDHMIGKETWDEYHAASKDDIPFRKVVNLINSLSAMDYNIIAITGRTEKFRQLTLNWFLRYHIDVDELLMRPDDVFLRNAEMKVELIRIRFDNSYKDIHFLIEDNEETVIEFFKLGITTLQIRNIK